MKDGILGYMASSVPDCRFAAGERMALHTTFRIGGPAGVFCLPETEAALAALLRLCREEGVPCLVIGRGSNLLFSDRGFDGAVISTAAMDGISFDGTLVRASCGTSLARLSSSAAEWGLAGLEFAHGIPGSVGGAVFMNAGAYGGEISSVLAGARVLLDGAVREYDPGEMHFGYRTSVLQSNGGILLSALFRTALGDREEITERMRDMDARRRDKQPLDRGSAGSFFKRPAGHFAGALIEQAGLKGVSVGGAMVSPKHAGFIVNEGDATCADVLALRDLVVERVREMSGVTLESEVRLVGDLP